MVIYWNNLNKLQRKKEEVIKNGQSRYTGNFEHKKKTNKKQKQKQKQKAKNTQDKQTNKNNNNKHNTTQHRKLTDPNTDTK